MKLLILLLPLIAVTGFLALLAPHFSPEWTSVSSSPTAAAVQTVKDAISGDSVSSSPTAAPAVVQIVEESISVDSILNHSDSSPPPLLIDAVEILQHQSFLQNTTTDEPPEPAINGVRPKPPPNLTKLSRLESTLSRARAAIKSHSSKPPEDPDLLPTGPVYRNAVAFHRSYTEMEKQFKIFVYEEGEPPLFHNGPCKSIYSTEGNFIHAVEMDRRFRTRDPERAHVFFLPVSVAMLVRFVYVRDSKDFSTIRETMRDYVGVVAGKYPFWNRSRGADHFMLSCHDWGPEASKSLPHLYQNSIRVLCNANTSEGFNPSKDVSFPEINLQTGFLTGFTGGPSPSQRPILAFFAGGLHGPIRPILIEQWEGKDNDIQVHKYLPHGVSYMETMRRSKYCLCPSGYEVASPRIVEAIYTGCVPVLISDHYVPPFSDVLNWKSFSVEVPVAEIRNLKKILMGISTRQYLRMYRRVLKVRRHFEVNSPPRRFDVYHMVLHSVWLRRLNVRVRDDQ